MLDSQLINILLPWLKRKWNIVGVSYAFFWEFEEDLDTKEIMTSNKDSSNRDQQIISNNIWEVS